MKHSIIIWLSALMFSVGCQSQNEEVKAIKETITNFSKAGDTHNVNQLETLLDGNYRIVMNQFFGSSEVSVVPRSVYLEKIESKEWGGDIRKLTFGNIEINGNTACAKVVMKGQKSTFKSLLVLVKDSNGSWKLVSDVPVM
ncbi:nuclear transport factor 2 family protein [Flagellimonas sp. S3867]|uniref:nuclear transport factor 2 family protein n=1 Tax=Flagellimonas sp. S3867 TaxID=2768063 RepID=UPI001682636D|nr:nuclear transport factor 2 family protein [Flagellimonas sp. S3867]